MPDIADDTDNLTVPQLDLLDLKPCPDRVAPGEIGTGKSFIDDIDHRGAGLILLSESASADERDAERFKKRRRDHAVISQRGILSRRRLPVGNQGKRQLQGAPAER